MVHEIKLKNQNGQVFYEKLTYIYIELPHFIKKESELITQLDRWLYFIKNLEDFEEIPSIFKTEVFEKAFEKAELAKFKPGEMDAYEGSLKDFRVSHNVIVTAFGDGEIKGRQEGRQEGQKKGLKKGLIEGRKEGIKEGRKEGIKEGFAQGQQNVMRDVAQKMLLSGMEFEKIYEITGISQEELEKL